jgi:RHS repeat-associated protein
MKGTTMRRFLSATVLAIGLLPSLASAEKVTYYHLDSLGNVRAMTDKNAVVVERHDYLPFGEDCTTAPCAPVDGIQPKRFTGKERDKETGLDYFGARYDRGNLGRFTTVDPAMKLSRGLYDPQKWNRYVYARNNPLARVDPNGEDDIFIFRPLAGSSDPKWGAVQSEAATYGNTVTIYNGADATAERYVDALQVPDAHVVFAGHTVEYVSATDNATHAGSVLLNANVGVGIAHPNGGTAVPVPAAKAKSVAVFACKSNDLESQYSGTTFTGDRPDTNTVAEDAAAAAYADKVARNGTPAQAATAARQRMVTATNRANAASGARGTHYAPPQVCTNGTCN